MVNIITTTFSVCMYRMRSLTLLIYTLVYTDGRVCISILHSPGDDPLGYETSAERWSPVQSVEKILLSVVSMLAGKPLTCYSVCVCVCVCACVRVWSVD